MKKLTKQQKKRYVKRAKLQAADEFIAALRRERDEIWEAIDKLPDGVRQEFIENAKLEWDAVSRITQRAVGEQIRNTVDKWTSTMWFIRGGSPAPIKVTSSYVPGELPIPDEIDKDKQL